MRLERRRRRIERMMRIQMMVVGVICWGGVI